MAEEDDSQKTEDPTQKKLQDAREKGEVPRSQEVVTFATLGAATLAIVIWGSATGAGFVQRFASYLEAPHAKEAGPGGMLNLAWSAVGGLGLVVAAPLAVMFFAAIAANVAQSPPLFTAERVKMKFSKLSPTQGVKRLFGGEAWVNYFKGLLKVVTAGAAGVWAVWPEADGALRLVAAEPAALGLTALDLTLRLLGAMLSVVALFAAIDWFWQRHAFMKKMRMSKQEIKDELKQSEGDPLVKMKIRQIRMERGRQRMMAAVPEATVVLMNPTHYAVALKYEGGAMAAPRCVAKGVDALALRIRALAEEHGVPVVENPPLARALYAAVDVDGEIPVEHYKAVAQIIGFIMRQRPAK